MQSRQGPTLDFLPVAAGNYDVQVLALSTAGTSSSATTALAVTGPSVAVCGIVGPIDLELNRIASFRVPLNEIDLGKPTSDEARATFDWVAKNATGQTVRSHSGAITAVPTDTPSPIHFEFVPAATGQYLIEVTVRRFGGEIAYQGTVAVVAVIGAPDTFKKQFTDFSLKGETPSSIIEDHDGNFIAAGIGTAGSWHVPPLEFPAASEVSQGDTFVLTKVDAALKPVTSFGTDGRVVIPAVQGDDDDHSSAIRGPAILHELDNGQLLIVANVLSAVTLIRLDGQTGQIDTTFGVNGYAVHSTVDQIGEALPGNFQQRFAGVFDVAVQPDGKIVVVGNGTIQLNSVPGVPASYPFVQPQPNDPYYPFKTRPVAAVLRFNADGTLDDGSGLDSTPYKADGQQVDEFGNGGMQWVAVATNKENGYGNWQSPRTESARAVLVQADGSIVIAGKTARVIEDTSNTGSTPDLWSEGHYDLFLLKLDGDGTPDASFGPDGMGTVNFNYGYPQSGGSAGPTVDVTEYLATDLLQDSRGRLVLVGASYSLRNNSGSIDPAGVAPDHLVSSGESHIVLARFTADGSPDASFGTDPVRPGVTASNFYGSEAGWGGAMTDDDKIVVAGYSPGNGGLLARFTEDGVPDSGFGNNGKIILDELILDAEFMAAWQSVIIASDNDIVVAGTATLKEPGASTTADGVGIAKYSPGDVAARDLVATARPDGDVDLTWVDGGSDEDGFVVLRATSLAGLTNASVVDAVASNVTAWRDATALPNTRYYYKVVAFDTNAGQRRLRGETNVANAATVPENTDYVLKETIAVPVTGATVESATALLADQQYKISVRGFFGLDANPDPARRQYADAAYGGYKPLPRRNSVWATRVHYGVGINDAEVDRNRFPEWGEPATDAAHTYAISYTPEATGTLKLNYHDDYYRDNEPGAVLLVDVYRALPSAPGELNATPDRANKRFELTWRNVASDYDRVAVERRLDNGAYEEVASLPAGVSSYTDDQNLLLNHMYSYRLRAFTAFGHSGYSNEAFGAIINELPVLEPIPPIVLRAGTPVSFQAVGVDPDGPSDQLAYQLVGAPSGAVIDAEGVVGGWTPTPREIADSYVWNVRATDVDGVVGERYVNVTVLPELATIPRATTPAYVVTQSDDAATLRVEGADDGPVSKLRYEWAAVRRPYGAPLPVITASTAGAVNTASVTFRAAGTYEFEVRIRDESHYSDHYGTSRDYYGTSRVVVEVAQVLGGTEVTEPVLHLGQGGTHDFGALARDQFGRPWA
ncbi:MAG TPA: hypothetical protein VK324_01085, partial [Tepidisphaeraceae bacterium]|nr:hypothetical protein [Tepidisphaeraceae bacterium]